MASHFFLSLLILLLILLILLLYMPTETGPYLFPCLILLGLSKGCIIIMWIMFPVLCDVCQVVPDDTKSKRHVRVSSIAFQSWTHWFQLLPSIHYSLRLEIFPNPPWTHFLAQNPPVILHFAVGETLDSFTWWPVTTTWSPNDFCTLAFLTVSFILCVPVALPYCWRLLSYIAHLLSNAFLLGIPLEKGKVSSKCYLFPFLPQHHRAVIEKYHFKQRPNSPGPITIICNHLNRLQSMKYV